MRKTISILGLALGLFFLSPKNVFASIGSWTTVAYGSSCLATYDVPIGSNVDYFSLSDNGESFTNDSNDYLMMSDGNNWHVLSGDIGSDDNYTLIFQNPQIAPQNYYERLELYSTVSGCDFGIWGLTLTDLGQTLPTLTPTPSPTPSPTPTPTPTSTPTPSPTPTSTVTPTPTSTSGPNNISITPYSSTNQYDENVETFVTCPVGHNVIIAPNPSLESVNDWLGGYWSQFMIFPCTGDATPINDGSDPPQVPSYATQYWSHDFPNNDDKYYRLYIIPTNFDPEISYAETVAASTATMDIQFCDGTNCTVGGGSSPTPTPAPSLTGQDVIDIVKNMFNDIVEFFGNVIFHSSVAFLGHTTYNGDTAGQVILPSGSTSANVVFSSAYEYPPVVTLTLRSPANLGWYRISDESTTGFTVETSQALPQDIILNWMAVSVNDRTELTISTPTPTPEPTATPTPTPTPVPTSTPPSMVLGINTGGGAQDSFEADADYSGGQSYTSSNSVDASAVANPAPQSVYQSVRYGNSFTYTIPNLTPNSNYTLRLDFNELYWSTSLAGGAGGVGSRVFNVSANGNQLLSNFDIFQTAGGANKAVVEEFPVTADSNGNVSVVFTTVTNNAMINGIELYH